jgi:hypothetical protein
VKLNQLVKRIETLIANPSMRLDVDTNVMSRTQLVEQVILDRQHAARQRAVDMATRQRLKEVTAADKLAHGLELKQQLVDEKKEVADDKLAHMLELKQLKVDEKKKAADDVATARPAAALTKVVYIIQARLMGGLDR